MRRRSGWIIYRRGVDAGVGMRGSWNVSRSLTVSRVLRKAASLSKTRRLEANRKCSVIQSTKQIKTVYSGEEEEEEEQCSVVGVEDVESRLVPPARLECWSEHFRRAMWGRARHPEIAAGTRILQARPVVEGAKCELSQPRTLPAVCETRSMRVSSSLSLLCHSSLINTLHQPLCAAQTHTASRRAVKASVSD